MDMKTVLTVTFWLEGFELGLSTTWNKSVDARAVFSVNAVIFLSAILFPFGYVLGLSTVKVNVLGLRSCERVCPRYDFSELFTILVFINLRDDYSVV